MSVEQVKVLSSKVDSLTPVLGKTIRQVGKFSKDYVKSENKNNEKLNELISALSVKQSEQMIPPGIMEEMLGLKKENATYQQTIVALIDERQKMMKDLEDIFESIEPSALRTALGAAGLGAALGLPSVLSPDGGPEGAPATAVLTDKGVYYNPLPKGSFKGGPGQVFGAPRDDDGDGIRDRDHAGIDITESNYDPKSDPRIPVVAVRGGVVIGDKYLAGSEYMSGLMIRQDDGYDARYLHMTPFLKPGDKVSAGQKIGRLVSLGKDGGNTHLHFELYKGNTLLDPTNYIREIQSGKPIKPKPQPSQQQALKPQPTQQQVAAVPSSAQQPSQQPQGSQAPSGGRGSVQPNYLSVLQLASPK